ASLKFHMASVHDGVRFQCPICSKIMTTQRVGALRHMKSAHPEINPQEHPPVCIRVDAQGDPIGAVDPSTYNDVVVMPAGVPAQSIDMHTEVQGVMDVPQPPPSGTEPMPMEGALPQMVGGQIPMPMPQVQHTQMPRPKKTKAPKQPRQVAPGERPWACPHCEKTYRREIDLTDHVEAVHKGRRWKCPECERLLTSRGNMSTHMKKHGMTLKEHPATIVYISPPNSPMAKRGMEPVGHTPLDLLEAPP
ncbi:hypothetical protein KIPB_013622, partial [Kipferlia bialata]